MARRGEFGGAKKITMKLRSVKILSAVGIAAFAVSLHADSLVGPGGSWQSWSAATLGPSNAPTYGGPYWNNFSGDGNNANIGWCMTGTGGCVIKSPPGPINYYGNNSNSVQNMSFQSQGVPVTVSLLGINTNQVGTNGSGTDYFGWYTINSNGTIGKTTQLWSSTSAVNSTSATFAPTAGTSYGFYFENVQDPGKSYESDYFWFMNAADNTATGAGTPQSTSLQHFTVFSSNPDGTFYLGLEDNHGMGDLDYNDMIVKVENGVPEPASILLIGCGLAVCGAFVRKNGFRKA